MHPVEALACAIATQEGWFLAGSRPQIRHNPGDLRFACQIGAKTPQPANGPPPIATFDTDTNGIAALFRQIWLQVAEGQTARQIIAQWAPASENNTRVYLENVLAWTKLPPDEPVLNLLPPLVRMTDDSEG
jgi:hypothetical protein